MTAAYVPAGELYTLSFKEHLIERGFDLNHFSEKELLRLMHATAAFFDQHFAPRKIGSLLEERVQV